MNRRSWLAASTVVCLAIAVPAWSQVGRVSLRDRLKAGLLCRRPEEFAFVDDVVDLVDQGRLSEALVLSTFKWSVEQRAHFPYFYFREGIKKRAAAVGVSI